MTTIEQKVGVLLINLGSPEELSKKSIRKYLKEFLSDRRVIDIHPFWRFLLLHCIILPFRPKKIIASYKNIWTESGSPLVLHTDQLASALQQQLGDSFHVAAAMRYGKPSLKVELNSLANNTRLVVIPLYPHYASSSTASSLAKVFELLSSRWDIPDLRLIHNFYDHPRFIFALSELINSRKADFTWDHILFSYHGIPERHLIKSRCPYMSPENGESRIRFCQKNPCPAEPFEGSAYCYRYQCFTTSRLLAKNLKLTDGEWSVSFQSRLGRTPWIKPYTDKLLGELYAKGIRRLAIVSPSFTADCLETVDEIGIRLKQQWLSYKGTEFYFIPSLNATPLWVEGLAEIIREKLH